ENVLDKLRPSNPLYDNLRHLYQSLKTEDIEDAGHVAPIDGKIEKGDDHEAIPLIRKKLAVLKDLDQVEEGSSTTYDQALFRSENVLDKLRPSNPLYDNLRHLYQSLKTEDIEDAGHVAPIDGKIEKGDDHEAIPLIRKKLAVLKDLDQVEEGSSTTYDQALF